MDFAPGDLVVCVDVSVHPGTSPDQVERLRWLVLGRAYRVRTVGLPFGCIHVVGDGFSMWEGWIPARFRKLNDGTDDAALIRRIKACQPAREPVFSHPGAPAAGDGPSPVGIAFAPLVGAGDIGRVK